MHFTIVLLIIEKGVSMYQFKQYSGKTPKHVAITKLLDTYIEQNNYFYSGLTSWVSMVSTFREGKFSSIVYGNDEQLDEVVREFCQSLTAWYSFTDGSTLKEAILSVLDSPVEESQVDVGKKRVATP